MYNFDFNISHLPAESFIIMYNRLLPLQWKEHWEWLRWLHRYYDNPSQYIFDDEEDDMDPYQHDDTEFELLEFDRYQQWKHRYGPAELPF